MFSVVYCPQLRIIQAATEFPLPGELGITNQIFLTVMLYGSKCERDWAMFGDSVLWSNSSACVLRVRYFRKKQPQAESNFNSKFPDFVRRLEDALYKDAKSLVSC
jgi:hypothetical protein